MTNSYGNVNFNGGELQGAKVHIFATTVDRDAASNTAGKICYVAATGAFYMANGASWALVNSGIGDVTAAGDNTFTGINAFENLVSFSNFAVFGNEVIIDNALAATANPFTILSADGVTPLISTNDTVVTANNTVTVFNFRTSGNPEISLDAGETFKITDSVDALGTVLEYDAGNPEVLFNVPAALDIVGSDPGGITDYAKLYAKADGIYSQLPGGDVAGPFGPSLFSVDAGYNIVSSISGGTITTGANNFFAGLSAGAATTGGEFNVAIGYEALKLNTDGAQNIAIGPGALTAHTVNGNNIAIGANAMATSTTSFENVGIGAQALAGNTTGRQNVAIGSAALQSCNIGRDNIAVGFNAAYSVSSGQRNVIIGLQNDAVTLTTGSDNINIAGGDVAISSEATTIRIGKTGTHTKAYVGGIYGVTPGGAAQEYVVMTDDGQLGTTAGAATTITTDANFDGDGSGGDPLTLANDITVVGLVTALNVTATNNLTGDFVYATAQINGSGTASIADVVDITASGAITADGDITSNAGNLVTSLDVVAGGELSGNTLSTVGSASIGGDITDVVNVTASGDVTCTNLQAGGGTAYVMGVSVSGTVDGEGTATIDNMVSVTVGSGGISSTGHISSSGNLELDGGISTGIVTKTDADSPYAVTSADSTIICDTTSGNIVVNLEAAATAGAGKIIVVKKVASANTVTINGDGSETIDGALTQVLTTQWTSITIQCDGSNWFII